MAKAANAIDAHAHYFPEWYLDLTDRAGGAARILSGNARRLLEL